MTTKREKYDAIEKQIQKEKDQRDELQRNIEMMKERLVKIESSISSKTTTQEKYGKTIQETESAYKKILQSSHTLLNVLKRETINLDQEVLN